MQFSDVVNSRYSCRAYLPQQVEEEKLQHIFQLAGRAPSNCNVQPWHCHVLSGAACENMRDKLCAEARANPMSTADFEFSGKFIGPYRDRQICAAIGLWEKQGVERKDKAMRDWSWMRNFQLFDAPHVAFVFLENNFNEELRIAADVGMYVQTLMLAMTDAGLGCCAQTSLSFYPHLVRRELGVNDNYKLLLGISFGYADNSDPANEFRTDRAPLNETTVFHR